MWGGKSATSMVLLVTARQAEQSVSWDSFALEKLYLTVQWCTQRITVSEGGEGNGELCRLCEVALAALAG